MSGVLGRRFKKIRGEGELDEKRRKAEGTRETRGWNVMGYILFPMLS